MTRYGPIRSTVRGLMRSAARALAPDAVTSGSWILSTGFWNDASTWDDSKNWRD